MTVSVKFAPRLSSLIAGSVLLAACAAPVVDSEFESLVNNQDSIAEQTNKRSRALVQQLETNGLFLEDPEINDVLQSVMLRLFPDTYADYTIKVTREQGENAFALPQGVVVMHLGLLGALENESQLAFVLAHEIGHIAENHGYASAKRRQESRMTAHVADLLTFGTGISYGHYADKVNGASQLQERDADNFSARTLKQARYDLKDAAGFFDVLQRYSDAWYSVSKNRKTAQSRSTRVSTHPSYTARYDNLVNRADTTPADVSPDDMSVKDYNDFRIAMLLAGIRENLNDFEYLSAIVQIDALSDLGLDTDDAGCLFGDAVAGMAALDADEFVGMVEGRYAGPGYVGGANQRLLSRAAKAYDETLSSYPGSTCALRGKGLTSAKLGDSEQATPALQQYLNRSDAPADARYIRYWIGRCAQSKSCERSTS